MSSWCFLIFLLSLFQTCFLSSPSPHLCLPEESDALLQLKQKHYHNVHPSSNYYSLESWKPDTDCCYWEGITCDASTGHMVGLDLSDSSLHGSIHSNSSLFHLHHLQTLDLSRNAFIHFSPSRFDSLSRLMHLNLSLNHFSGLIPSQISQLTDLVSLDLSFNQFVGQIPSEISWLTKLVFLDLSIYSLDIFFDYSSSPRLEIPNLGALVQNLSSLRELHLDGVNLSAQENRDWCHNLSSALPNLHVLSMIGCLLGGPLDASISRLRFLSQLHLDFNQNVTSRVPSSLVNLTSLTFLGLSDCGLYGDFPTNVFLQPNLTHIELSSNPLLSSHLPEFPQVINPSLQYLSVSNTNFQGKLPSSVGNLKLLQVLDLNNCNFSGPIPPSLANLTHLTELHLAANSFSGQLPPFYRGKFPNLELLDLRQNLLQGPIPSYLFSLPSLQVLALSDNQFNDFDDCILEGKNLSYDGLSVNRSGDNFVNTQFLGALLLSSCNISKFPEFLKTQNELMLLDLSSNRIEGAIPQWIWQTNMLQLYLSNNSLTSLELPLPNHTFNIKSLDLHSNMIQDCHSIAPCFLQAFNQSNNAPVSHILGNLTSLLSEAMFFSISNNLLTGKIPFSICNASNLEVLDLSNNQLSGTIPTCLSNSNLGVLNLESNKLHGPIPPTFTTGCGLQTLKLNNNTLQGKIPRSLANCEELEVLDIGDNQLNGTFPYWLENLSKLQVLVMRSNNFGGPVGQLSHVDSPFPKLHAFDISFNTFTGYLPLQYILHWKAMMTDDDNSQLNYISFQGSALESTSVYYQDTVGIVDKGVSLEMQKILTTFITVDLSNNKFNGGIPDAMGELKSLILLNLSGNSLTGQIPSSFGNMNKLESLDLSRNNLSGQIPSQLTKLTFLSIFNLSDNNLTGRIPQGNQFDTFSDTSYESNAGLCGSPLSRLCGIANTALPNASTGQQQEESTCSLHFSSIRMCSLDWRFAIAGYCSGVIIGVVIGQQLFWRDNDYSICGLRIKRAKRSKRSKRRR